MNISRSRAGPGLSLVLSFLFLGLVPNPLAAQSAIFEQFPETSPMAGEMAPAFRLMTLENEPFNLMSVVADMPVVVEFGSFT
ncbi:MAG: hypothetical protein HKO65_20245 [Gemmatimonadetes bacterium]|nr:hypothetical protein [Gemmatimonadota bacterium]